MAEELGERTELPTPRRLGQARTRGQIAKSPDLSAAASLAGALVVLLVLGEAFVTGLAGMLRYLLQTGPGGAGLSTTAATDALRWSGAQTLRIAAPLLLLTFAATYLAHFMQVGWLFTLQPLAPKLNRMNPLSGLGRLFGRRNVGKTGVGMVKLLTVGAVAVAVILLKFPQIAALPMLDPLTASLVLGRIALDLLIWILALLLVIGVIDWLYQRWRHTQDLKMTKQEVKEERRSMEGDAETKARRLRMARQMILQRMRQAVPTADVVVTNPTHFSVAIKYDPDTMHAPKVVAKGADFLAFRIREIAAMHRVPVVEKPPLARALYAGVEVGRHVTPEFYEAVAEVLAYVYRLEGKAA